MPYEVLARKWRPQVFGDVVGQEHVTQTLINAIKTGRLAHAFLFSGPRGVGKTSVARILAKAMNCEHGEPGVPCNKCQSCIEITDGSSVDVQEIDGASNRGIDEIRELRENVRYMPSANRYRIYIIDEIHMLTIQAFNALLKTLEEPPSHVKFIFATTEFHKVPVTILSRCQQFDFKRIPLTQIVSYLEKIAKEENIKISQSSLALMAREAEGSMRDAESLLDQVVSFTGPNIEDNDVTEVLGIIDRDIIFEASRAIIEGSSQKCLEIVNQIYNFGYDIKEFYRILMDQFRNILISLIAPQNYLLDMTGTEREEVRRQAEQAGEEKLQILLNFLINREGDLRFSSNPRLILETTMIKLCRLGDFMSFGDLLKRIESLEGRLSTVQATGEQPEPFHLADPGSSWAAMNKAEGREEPEKPRKAGQSWSDFLSFLSSKSKPMFNVLKGWQVLNLAEKSLEIAKANHSFSSSYFDDPETFGKLAEYCRDFFQRDIKIKIVASNQPVSEKKISPKKERPDLPLPVQDIMDIFQGEIKEG
ncbi:MAG: DNA polymerase III subunit gamma/tau [Thermodesulfobacteriota bacterium]|nr:DNA polymerase III subunit gamma/tau [Thermodesulfobacteriota bacterium]